MLCEANFYFPVIDRLETISRALYILQYSCSDTFAQKFDSKITKITAQYGNPVKVKIIENQKFKDRKGNVKERQVEKEYALLDYKTLRSELDYKKYDWKNPNFPVKVPIDDVFAPMRHINWRSLRNLDSICAICGTDKDVQMHHIRHIRKGKVTGFAQLMKQINRKTIPLCSTHHREVHQGKYDSLKLSDLYGLDRFLL